MPLADRHWAMPVADQANLPLLQTPLPPAATASEGPLGPNLVYGGNDFSQRVPPTLAPCSWQDITASCTGPHMTLMPKESVAGLLKARFLQTTQILMLLLSLLQEN